MEKGLPSVIQQARGSARAESDHPRPSGPETGAAVSIQVRSCTVKKPQQELPYMACSTSFICFHHFQSFHITLPSEWWGIWWQRIWTCGRLHSDWRGDDLPGSERTTSLATAEQPLIPLWWFCFTSHSQVMMQLLWSYQYSYLSCSVFRNEG